jgi:hypothetical protein
MSKGASIVVFQGGIMNEKLGPERCTLHCHNMKNWQADPDGFTSTLMGHERNSKVAERALEICPGVEIFLQRPVDPTMVTINEDESAIIASGIIKVHCRFHEADLGPSMGG